MCVCEGDSPQEKSLIQQCVCCILVHISVGTWGSQRMVTNFLELESQMVVIWLIWMPGKAQLLCKSGTQWYQAASLGLWMTTAKYDQRFNSWCIWVAFGWIDLIISCTFTEVVDLNTQLMGVCWRKRPDHTRCRFIWHCFVTGSPVPKNGTVPGLRQGSFIDFGWVVMMCQAGAV